MKSTNGIEHSPLNNIIICIAESATEESPRFVDIDQILAGNNFNSPNNDKNKNENLIKEKNYSPNINEEKNVVLINTKKNSFDWTAHHILSVYKDHPLVDSDYYLYLLGN